MHLFIVNPASRSCPEDVEDKIRARFPDAEVIFTKAAGDAYAIAKAAVERPCPPKVLVACGGDGTFREVATAGGFCATLGILPLGTVNQISDQLGINTDLNFALDILENDNVTTIYPGVCTIEGECDPYFFFIGMSAGVDADAVHLVNRPLKKFVGALAYGLSFARRMASPVTPEMRIIRQGLEPLSASQLIALKNPLYGGVMRFSKKLALTEPGVEIAYTDGGKLDVFGFFLGSMLGSHEVNLEVAPGEAVRLELPEPGRVQLDGDAILAREMTVTACDKPMRVLSSLG